MCIQSRQFWRIDTQSIEFPHDRLSFSSSFMFLNCLKRIEVIRNSDCIPFRIMYMSPLRIQKFDLIACQFSIRGKAMVWWRLSLSWRNNLSTYMWVDYTANRMAGDLKRFATVDSISTISRLLTAAVYFEMLKPKTARLVLKIVPHLIISYPLSPFLPTLLEM